MELQNVTLAPISGQLGSGSRHGRPDAPACNQTSAAPILITRDDEAKAYAEGHCGCIDQVHFAQASFTLELGPTPTGSWIDVRVPVPPGAFSVFERTGGQWLGVSPGVEAGYFPIRVTQGQTVLVCRTAGLCR